jgi:hypothetical protein
VLDKEAGCITPSTKWAMSRVAANPYLQRSATLDC